jgi:hypothetical protein
VPGNRQKRLQHCGVLYSAGFDLVLNHLLPLARVFDGLLVHDSFLSTRPIQVKIIQKHYYKKGLDPSVKCYNN